MVSALGDMATLVATDPNVMGAPFIAPLPATDVIRPSGNSARTRLLP